MDGTWLALIGITLLNVGGWVYTKVYTYGSLTQKVKDMDEKIKDLDNTINNGLVEQLGKVSVDLAKLEGSVNTFIDITKRKES